jgi:hypothetical protein
VHNGVWSRRGRRSRHLMSTTRQRAKRRALSQFTKCPTSFVAGAGFDVVVRVQGGVDASPRSCTSTFVLNPAPNGKGPAPKGAGLDHGCGGRI